MWGPIWPSTPEISAGPRDHHGVHMPTWLSNEMAHLFDEYLPSDWRERHDEPGLWALVHEIPDEALWGARNALRNYLFAFVRERARLRWRDEQVSAARVVAAGTLLDPNALTIGFARRFTGYKRPELIFHNPQRLQAISTRRGVPCRSCSPARRIPPTRPASTICSRSTARRSIRRSADGSRSWTTTICTSRTSWCRAATSG
jgi:starch phosphorylase